MVNIIWLKFENSELVHEPRLLSAFIEKISILRLPEKESILHVINGIQLKFRL